MTYCVEEMIVVHAEEDALAMTGSAVPLGIIHSSALIHGKAIKLYQLPVSYDHASHPFRHICTPPHYGSILEALLPASILYLAAIQFNTFM